MISALRGGGRRIRSSASSTTIELDDSLGYMRHCLKKEIMRDGRRDGREEGRGGEDRKGERMEGWMQKKVPVISQTPTTASVVCGQHRVQEAAMVAVRETVVSTLNTGFGMPVATVHRTFSPP